MHLSLFLCSPRNDLSRNFGYQVRWDKKPELSVATQFWFWFVFMQMKTAITVKLMAV
jgi:hypothetical protein